MASKTASAHTFQELKAEALRNWNRWAREMADGKPMPPARELIDAGIILGRDTPGDLLERDAAIVKRFNALRAARIQAKAEIAAIHQRDEGLEERIAAVEAELDELRGRRQDIVGPSWDAGNAGRKLQELIRQNPDLLEGEVLP